MANKSDKKTVTILLAVVFFLFLIGNAVLHTLGTMGGLQAVGYDPLAWMRNFMNLLSEDTTTGVRLLVFLIVAAISWFLGRGIYRWLVRADVPVGDSISTVYVFILFLVLTFSTLLFVGFVQWFWFPLVFLILLVFSTMILSKLLGMAGGVAALVVTVAAIGITWWMAA